MNYTLIVPPSYETAVTGFLAAGEKQFGRNRYRIELWAGETFPRAFKNGRPLAGLAICPATVRAMGNHMKDSILLRAIRSRNPLGGNQAE